MSKETRVSQTFEGEQLEGVLVSRRDNARRPGVIIFPTVMGVADLELGFARDLVHLGYTAFVADLYGKQFKGSPRETMRAQMDRLRGDRAGLRRRLTAVLNHVRTLDAVYEERVAAIGYCFGGQCALDLARSGADIAGAASFHGLFDPPDWPTEPIKGKVIAFHGWDDPLATPDTVLALAKELSEAGADWQIHAFGNVGHSFTNPAADGSTPGLKYDALTADRAWTGFVNFLEELFGVDG